MFWRILSVVGRPPLSIDVKQKDQDELTKLLSGGAATVLDDGQKQRIIAMVCSDPPEGRSRWTVRLVAQKAVKRRLVPRVGRGTRRILLLDHDPKPWRRKMWCVAELNDEYIAKMEDVLETWRL